MDYRKEDNGLKISLLGMGTMRLPCKLPIKKEANALIDFKRAEEIVDYAHSHGVTYYDTAYMYHAGKSEGFIGKALKKYPRDSFFIADKLPIWACPTKAGMDRVFKRQQSRTGFDRFDYYLLHSLNKDNYEKCERFGAYEFLEKKRDSGEIGKIGFSFHGTVDDLKRIVGDHDWDFAQIQLNYLDWVDQKAREQYEILTEKGIPVVIMEPVRGGKLAAPGKEAEDLFKAADAQSSIASWALRFAASLPNVMTVLSGMSSLEQLKDNINTLSDFKPLDENEKSIIENVVALLHKRDIIPCTGCDYCADCPKGVEISSIFKLYNRHVNEELDAKRAGELYRELKVVADACVQCGKCKDHCPQSIDIPARLHGEVGKLFSK